MFAGCNDTAAPSIGKNSSGVYCEYRGGALNMRSWTICQMGSKKYGVVSTTGLPEMNSCATYATTAHIAKRPFLISACAEINVSRPLHFGAN